MNSDHRGLRVTVSYVFKGYKLYFEGGHAKHTGTQVFEHAEHHRVDQPQNPRALSQTRPVEAFGRSGFIG